MNVHESSDMTYNETTKPLSVFKVVYFEDNLFQQRQHVDSIIYR